MKKRQRILCALLALIAVFSAFSVIACGFFGGGAAVIASDVTLIKAGLFGEKISFSDSDFKKALATSDISKITITQKAPRAIFLINSLFCFFI